MHAVTVRAPGELEFSRSTPELPGAGVVAVQMATVGICHTDTYIVAGTHPTARYPLVPGHELCGTVTAVGLGVPATRLGEPVAVVTQLGCTRCEDCQSGRLGRCTEMIELGATRDGGWQEELLVPAWAAIPLPESIPLSCGALIEPAANAVAAVVAGEVRRGDRVLVVGPGTIGLLVAQAVRVYRPASVSIAGLQRDSDRLALARRLGADEAVVVSGHRGFDAMPEPKRPFNVVIQCSDSTRATELAISAAARGGRIVLEGYTASGQSICMDPDQLVLEELTLRGVLGWTLSDFRSAIDLAGSGVFDFEPLITHRFGLSQYRQALQVAQSRESGAIKVVFTGANV